MKPRHLAFAYRIVLSIFLTPLFAVASQTSSIKISPNDERDYATLVLDNGIEFILISDPSVDKSAASLSVGAGLMNDPESQQGMAHYLEHMLFLGTDRFPESNGYSEFMSKNGGSANAYTWMDITNYMFEIKNDAFDEALDRFSDFFKSPRLYPEYSEKEKNAVNAEWSMRREMDFFARFKLSRSMMGSHPANRFLIGNLESLSDKKDSQLHPELIKFYEQYYSANIMKVAMVSHLSVKQLKKIAEKHFASIKNKSIKKPVVTQSVEFSQMAGKKIYYVPNEDVKQLVLDFTIKNNTNDYKSKPNYFVSYLLGSEMPGTPAFELKKKGLISSLSVGATPDLYGNYGSFSINIDLTEAGMLAREEITAVVMQYIGKIKKEGIDSRYFKEIKTSLDNQFRFLEKTNAFDYVSNLADEMQSYPATDAIIAPYLYTSFDEKSIKKVLRQLNLSTLRIWYISQSEPHDKTMHFYDGRYKIENISTEEIKRWSMPVDYALALPEINRLMPEKFTIKNSKRNKQNKPEIIYEHDGLSAWLYPSKNFTQQPEGVLNIYFNSPARANSISGQILLSIWSELYHLNQSALITEASIAGMNVGLSDVNGLELTISGFTDKQPLLIKSSLAALNFKVEKESFQQASDRYIRQIKNGEKKFPFYQLFYYLNSIAVGSGYDNDLLIQAAKKLKPEDLTRFMNEVMSNNHIRVFAFGNYAKEDIDFLVKEIHGSMPAKRKVTPYFRTKVLQPQAGQSIVYRKDLDVADVAVLNMHVHPESSLQQEARARVLSNHLRTAVYDKLRTEEQLAYAVTASMKVIKDYTAMVFAIQSPAKDVATIQKRFNDFKVEYKILLDELSEKDFNQFKNSTLIKLNEKPKNLREEMIPLLTDWHQEQWEFDTRHKLIKEVEKISLEDIRSFYQETVLMPEASRISIQLRGSKFKDKPYLKLKNELEVKRLSAFHKKARYQM